MQSVRRVLALLALLATVVVLAACGDSDSDEGDSGDAGTTTTAQVADVEFTGSVQEGLEQCYPEPRREALTIGHANAVDANEALNAQARGMKLETERLGGTFINADSGGDIDKQVSDIERMVAQRVDALIVFPLDPKALAPALRKAEAAGIPVVGVEVVLDDVDPGPGYDTQVWMQRDYSAYLQAQAAAGLLEPGSTIAQIGLGVPTPSTEFAVERATYWAEQFGLEPLGRADNPNPSGDVTGGEQAMTEILGQYPDVEGIISFNEESATGAASAARAQGIDIPIVGQNGGSLGYGSVESGKIDATVQYQNADVGICAARGAYDLAQGVEVPKAVIPGELKVITRDNVAEVPTVDDVLRERFGKTE
jgi:ribose transport system substrate-binding protein